MVHYLGRFRRGLNIFEINGPLLRSRQFRGQTCLAHVEFSLEQEPFES